MNQPEPLRRLTDVLSLFWYSRYVLPLVAFISFVTYSVLTPLSGSEQTPDAFAYLLITIACASLVFRFTHPLQALLVASVSTVIFWISDYVGCSEAGVYLLHFVATRYGGSDRKKVWTAVWLSLGLLTGVAIIGVLVESEDLPAIAVAFIFGLHLTCAIFGEAVYQRVQHVEQLEERNRALESEVDTKAQLATLDERNRIAREMHDIIAHGMSSIVVQAAAGKRVVHNDPAAASEVFESIEGISRDSVVEMRRMLGVLRNPAETEADLEPQPSIDDFRKLGDRATEAGVETRIEILGEQRSVSPGIELTGYRVIQEALTNVVKHGGRPVSAHVVITYSDTALDISVIDNGLGAGAASSNNGTGHGLLGMRERVELYNGTFSADARAGGGYEVRVSLPVSEKVPA